jgi:hypothetical protein
MSATTIALAGLVALLVLIPTRRLHLAGWRRESLTTYFIAVWLLGVVVTALPSPAKFLIPLLLVAYLAPFVTLRDGLDRLLGRPPGGGSGGSGRDSRRTPVDDQPPMKNVTPPEDDGR